MPSPARKPKLRQTLIFVAVYAVCLVAGVLLANLRDTPVAAVPTLARATG